MAIFQQAESIDVAHLVDCKVYPNPTDGKVIVVTSDHLVAAYLTDMLGRREDLKFTAAGNGDYLLDVTSCSPAVYLLTIIPPTVGDTLFVC